VNVELALDCRCALGEGPIWDHRAGRLLFVDIDGHQVHCFDPRSGIDRSWQAGEYVSAVALAEGGEYLVALQHDIGLLDFAAGRLQRVARAADDRPDLRFNDGYVDPRGRFWAGTLSLARQQGQAALYRLDGTELTRVVENVTTSNGIDWSDDGRLMYYVDTGSRRVDVFDVAPETGTIDNRRPLITFPEADGKPDGLILDAEGFLWVALWQGSAVRRYSPDGRLVQQIDLPVSCPTKCAFGGERLDELYITSARAGLATDAERAREPHAGSLFVARPGVTGRRATIFRAR
jgi:sugar lactone lactonase YvrE